jgi:AraC-like DNA-binding protein
MGNAAIALEYVVKSSLLFSSYRPGPPLDEFVDSFWIAANAEAPRKERILPTGTFELVVNLRDDQIRVYEPAQLERCRRLSGAVLSGPYSRAFACDASQHAAMLGVHFKPGGAFPFIGAHASDLSDTHADLADVWGRPGAELRERLCSADTPVQQLRVMETVLRQRLRRTPKSHPAVRIALQMFGSGGAGAAVRDAAREVGVCRRHLTRLFNAEVGLTPKLFCRLLRFQRARGLAEQFAHAQPDRVAPGQVPLVPDWAELATTCGYFDQSHLINDFDEFSGLTPTHYLRQGQPDPRLKENHMPIPQ